MFDLIGVFKFQNHRKGVNIYQWNYSDFEQKLSAMGFEMTSSKTATLDLTPIKGKGKDAKSKFTGTAKVFYAH